MAMEQRSVSEEEAGKHCGFPEAPDLLISDEPVRQRPQVPIHKAARAGFARFGYHRTLRQLRWARTVETGHCSGALGTNCAGAHQNSAASLP